MIFGDLVLVEDVYDSVTCSGYNHFNVEFIVLVTVTPDDPNLSDTVRYAPLRML